MTGARSHAASPIIRCNCLYALAWITITPFNLLSFSSDFLDQSIFGALPVLQLSFAQVLYRRVNHAICPAIVGDQTGLVRLRAATAMDNIYWTRRSNSRDRSRDVASPDQEDRVRLKIITLRGKSTYPVQSRNSQLGTARVAADHSRKSRIFCQARRGNPFKLSAS